MITFASFRLGDCEDPELYAAQPIWEWEQTEQGKWVKEHAMETPYYRICNDPETYSYRVDIYGQLDEQHELIYRLKYGFPSPNNR
jgi:hypothetical protein